MRSLILAAVIAILASASATAQNWQYEGGQYGSPPMQYYGSGGGPQPPVQYNEEPYTGEPYSYRAPSYGYDSTPLGEGTVGLPTAQPACDPSENC